MGASSTNYIYTISLYNMMYILRMRVGADVFTRYMCIIVYDKLYAYDA
jgi:hypothetical protein